MDQALATMHPVVAAILDRRSVRSGFEDRPVAEAVIGQVVSAGLAAPSSKNAQPWRLHVVTDRETLAALAYNVSHAKLADTYVPVDPATGKPRDYSSTVAESAGVLASVPLAIFIENTGRFSAGRRSVAAVPDPDAREDALVGYGFELIGLGAAIQNMWLAAGQLGLSGVFMGDVLVAESAIRERLAMAGDLAGVLALGYSDDPPVPKTLAPDRLVRHNGAK